jgi:hypothetical protein
MIASGLVSGDQFLRQSVDCLRTAHSLFYDQIAALLETKLHQFRESDLSVVFERLAMPRAARSAPARLLSRCAAHPRGSDTGSAG